MLPEWLKSDLFIKWYMDGRWELIPMTQTADSLLHGTCSDKAEIHVALHEHDEDFQPGQTVYRLEATITPIHGGMISGVQMCMPVSESYTCSWMPLLSPLEDMAIGDRVFRSPAIVLESGQSTAALIPDLDGMQAEQAVPHIMNYVKDGHTLIYGLCDYKETGHVYHQLKPRPHELDRALRLRVYLVQWQKDQGQQPRDFRKVEQFLWEKFGQKRMLGHGEAFRALDDLKPYVRYAYQWAFESWKNVCWQEFRLDGKEVGGVVFIVTAKQKPGAGQENRWREPKSLWNQAWFCSLRTSYGYYWWGRQEGRASWMEKAEKNLEFALSAPQNNGLFPSYFKAGTTNQWEDGRWYMSAPRCPAGHETYVHLLDSSWTCYWMLKWYRDLKKDPRILPYVRSYAERLLALQNDDGSFPAWVHPKTLERSGYLTESPEASSHIMLLCLLHEIEPDTRYLQAAGRAAEFVARNIIPAGRWEDFETYWSCSNEWEGKHYGTLDPRSGLYNQCNFGMYWTAEAMKSLYQVTGERVWLDHGEQVVAEIALYQQIWEPPFFPVPTLGGFGVMNSDDEWNDARQSLFALTFFDYYRLTGNRKYLARGLWAMKASFYMMYCPLNPEVRKLYESVHPQLNETDFGFHMENFNHHDGSAVNGLGEFTIFDWGCGAAATSLAEFICKLTLN